MIDRLIKNSWTAISEVGISIAGSIGLVWLISFLYTLDEKEKTAGTMFSTYFDGGEIGLTILSLSGAVYMVLFRLGKLHNGFSLPLFLAMFGPIIAAALLVGDNPGFETSGIGPGRLWILWLLYWFIHVFWLILLLIQPVLQTPEESGAEQESRVKGIARRAAQHAK